ncbi:MAG: S24/S26 family peptidase [Phycisphaerales bacterium]|nr:S24/S26 family peptidase [Phycisphaerales bacterium]
MRNPITKRRLGRLGITLGAVTLATIGVRQAVAQVYYVPMHSMEPELPAGSRVLVYKLAGQFSPGDIVVYRNPSGQAYLGRVEGADAATGALTISRNGTPPTPVAASDVIGRVVLSTR